MIKSKQVKQKLLRELIRLKRQRAEVEPNEIRRAIIKAEIDAHIIEIASIKARGGE